MRRNFLSLVWVGVLLFSLSGFSDSSKKSRIDRRNETVDLASVLPPKESEVCFTPGEPCDLKLTKFVDTATKSIDIAIFDINLDSFVHHVLVKSKKIPVRILVDKRQSKGNHSLVPLLIKAGAKVRFGRQRGVMHNKFTIVDGKAVETGSFNYTNHASQANQENQVYLLNPAIVERYVQRFDKMWSEGTPAEILPTP